MNNPRRIIADVAREYVGLRETSTNRGPHLDKFWKATSYPSGSANREPWCSAFVSFCVQEADRRSPALALRIPPTFPAVDQWLPWAERAETGCVVFRLGSVRFAPMAGDIVVFKPTFSHVGIVAADYTGDGMIHTIEGNTNEAGSREGDGVWEKSRAIKPAWSFIRVPAVGLSTGDLERAA